MLLSAAASGFVAGGGSAYSADYRRAASRATQKLPYNEDRIARLALSLGRSTGALTAPDANRIFRAVNQERIEAVPAELANTWQKLLRMSSMLITLEDTPWFHSVGYEFEVAHPEVYAYDDFPRGVKAYARLIAKSFGRGDRNPVVFDEKARVRDRAGRLWGITREWVRETDPDKSGWEIISPPFRMAAELESLAAFRWRLGTSPFGMSNKMTGLHQTYELVPRGEQADAKLMGRVAANVLLLQAQFGPTLFELLDVRRFGAHENFFMRPLVYDHGELLKRLSAADPARLELADIHKMMFEDYIEKEFVAQVRSSRDADDPEVPEMLGKWPPEKRRAFRPNWKYRDGQIKFNLESPRDTLFEIRIGDYVSSSPERTLLQTLIYQHLIHAAYRMALEGSIWKLDIPERAEGESDNEYWKRLLLDPRSTKEVLAKALGVTDPELAGLFFSRKFDTKAPRFAAREKITYGFEVEGWTEKLVGVILPRKGKLRARWAGMSGTQRVKAMEEMGFRFDGEYSEENYRVLTSEFLADFEKYPFLSPELHVEASGNWEIKTHNRGIATLAELKANLQSTRQALRAGGEKWGGVHLHMFLPEELVSELGKSGRRERFVDVLERMSFYMAVAGYAEAPINDPYHGLDSWSLDRYSPRDLAAIARSLGGDARAVTGVQQKYHNIAYRPVRGGLDLEVRDVGDDVDYGLDIVARLRAAASAAKQTATERLEPAGLEKDPPLFMEFRDHANLRSVERYTLEHAVGLKYALSTEERDLLRKLQFEIYKPSMSEYMHFDDFSALEETADKDLDAKFVRTNFENNLAIPLLNYDEQAFLTSGQKARLARAREAFVGRVYRLLGEIRGDPALSFLAESADFLHLADYLKRSTHPSRPDFSLVKGKEAERQREALEELTYRMRRLVIRFVRETRLDLMVKASLPNHCESLLTR